MRLSALCVLALGLTACSMTVPVQGQVQAASETFTGSATGYMDGSGKLSVVSSLGASCSGDFVYVSAREGSGTFRCSDGRSGPFTFVSTGRHGTGHGTLGGQAFIFTFGA